MVITFSIPSCQSSLTDYNRWSDSPAIDDPCAWNTFEKFSQRVVAFPEDVLEVGLHSKLVGGTGAVVMSKSGSCWSKCPHSSRETLVGGGRSPAAVSSLEQRFGRLIVPLSSCRECLRQTHSFASSHYQCFRVGRGSLRC